MWKRYKVELEFTSPFAAASPKNPKDIEAMLLSRMPSEANIRKRRDEGEEIISPEKLAEMVEEGVEADEEAERAFATFMKDEQGLYFEARCVRAHIKDCSNVLQKWLEIKALKSKVSNHVYVEPAKLYLGKEEVDGNITRIVHAMTPKGFRSSLKFIDFVDNAKLSFTLKVLDDGVITENILKEVFEYGGTHGMGQERSQDFGRYDVKTFAAVVK